MLLVVSLKTRFQAVVWISFVLHTNLTAVPGTALLQKIRTPCQWQVQGRNNNNGCSVDPYGNAVGNNK